MNYDEFENEDRLNFKLNIELNQNELLRLKKFSKSTSDSDALSSIQDITDILKDMIVEIQKSKFEDFAEKLMKLLSQVYHEFNNKLMYILIFTVSFSLLLIIQFQLN